jgi:hypothetical protein
VSTVKLPSVLRAHANGEREIDVEGGTVGDAVQALVGRLLLFDALDASFSELRLNRDPSCPTCSDAARAARERGDWQAPSVFGADQPFALGNFGAAR